jgi:cytochrome b6-f complex iron-sulfur subunit
MVTSVEPNRKITRRNFLGWLWLAAVTGVFAQTGAALYQFFRPQVESDGFGGTVVAGTPEEFAPGTVSHVREGRFYISCLEDGGMLALWQRCTHLGCTVPWRADVGEFNCPCHSSLFNRKGEVLGGPAPRPMDLFPVDLEDGKVVVDTARPIEREAFDPSQLFYPG